MYLVCVGFSKIFSFSYSYGGKEFYNLFVSCKKERLLIVI